MLILIWKCYKENLSYSPGIFMVHIENENNCSAQQGKVMTCSQQGIWSSHPRLCWAAWRAEVITIYSSLIIHS